MKRLFWLATGLPMLVLGAATCGGPAEYWTGGDVDVYCREHPEDCPGEIGSSCRGIEDCYDGTCCTNKECDHGMCTYRCDGDIDCPDAMLCEHGYCYFTCDDDRDCGPGQKCKHDHAVCEYD